jgi:hypothetical protein
MNLKEYCKAIGEWFGINEEPKTVIKGIKELRGMMTDEQKARSDADCKRFFVDLYPDGAKEVPCPGCNCHVGEHNDWGEYFLQEVGLKDFK